MTISDDDIHEQPADEGLAPVAGGDAGADADGANGDSDGSDGGDSDGTDGDSDGSDGGDADGTDS